MFRRISDNRGDSAPGRSALFHLQRFMPRNDRLQLMPVGDTDRFMPSPQQPVRVRARTMLADTHFEPHSHAWAQLAYCATGVVQVTAKKTGQAKNKADEITYIVPPSRAVWIAPGARHHITVLKAAQLRTLYIDASATPEGWNGCRMIVVSPLLRELIHSLDAGTARPLTESRQRWLSTLVLDEITHADTQALGVPLPHPQTGDKRLRALCEAFLRAPSERATLAGWATNIGASRPSWQMPCPCWHAARRWARWLPPVATPARAHFRPCSRPPWGSHRASFNQKMAIYRRSSGRLQRPCCGTVDLGSFAWR